MKPRDSRVTLWKNVESLMQERWGEVNINRLARECEVGAATVQRIKEQNTSVGLVLIDKIAVNFDLETWQILVPDMDPKATPALQPGDALQRRVYDRIMSAAREIVAAEPDAKKYLP
jgi:hypothetical protein